MGASPAESIAQGGQGGAGAPRRAKQTEMGDGEQGSEGVCRGEHGAQGGAVP